MQYTDTTYHGFPAKTFSFLGRDAIIVFPEVAKNRRFCMKTEYFDAFPDTEIRMLQEGYTLTYIQNRTRWGTDDDCTVRSQFAAFIAATFDLHPRFICVGMSCGGFHAVNFASRYPEQVAFLYLDAPLLSMESYMHSWESGAKTGRPEPFPDAIFREYQNAYGFSNKGEVAMFRDEPIHRLQVLADHKIPVGLVYGGSDHEVLPYENAERLIAFYETTGVPFRVFCKPDCDHHPHGLEDPTALLAFMKESML